MNTINLDTLVLARGAHEGRDKAVCAMEAVAWLANEEHSDAPQCTCPSLAAYVRTLNDRMPNNERQRLKAYLPRLIGTRDGNARKRGELLAWAAVVEFAPSALRAAGLGEWADKLQATPLHDWGQAKQTADAATNAAYAAYAADAATNAADAAAYAAAYAADAAAYAAAYAADAAAYARVPSIWDIALAVLDRALAITDTHGSAP